MRYQLNVEIDKLKIDELIVYLEAFISQHSVGSDDRKAARLLRFKEKVEREDLISVYFE